MGVETRVLNLFLHEVPEGARDRVWADHNLTTKRVSSWGDSLLYGGKVDGGSLNLGLTDNAMEIAKLIKEELEKMHISHFVTEINLYNGEGSESGRRHKMKEELYHQIHYCLRNLQPRIYSEPKVILNS